MRCTSAFTIPLIKAYLVSKGCHPDMLHFPDTSRFGEAYQAFKSFAGLKGAPDAKKKSARCASVILWLRGHDESAYAWAKCVDSGPAFARKLNHEKHEFRRMHNELRQANKLPVVSGVFSRRFYRSRTWLALRYEALRNAHGRCCLCGASGVAARLEVDHIKPKSIFPELALDPSNLQVLCRDCNQGKGNTCTFNWSNVHHV